MKDDLKKDLLRDELLREVARKRRMRRSGQIAALVLPLALAFGLMPSEEAEPVSEKVVEIPEVVAPEPSYTVLESEQELLDHLADLGPILVTQADGSKVLYLTEH